DEEGIELMLSIGAFLVPTLSIVNWIAEQDSRHGIPSLYVERAKRALDVQKEMVQRAHSAGVPIVMGTDSSGTVCPFGQNSREFEHLADAGLSTTEALKTGTSIAAEYLGLSKTLGTLTAGKLADFV